MGRCLIVANQTLGGEALDRAVRERIERGIDDFYVVVPMVAVEHETALWRRGFAVGEAGWSPAHLDMAREAMEEEARLREQELDEARLRAERRLRQMIERTRSSGAQADGEVGEPDPVEATRAVLRERSFDEVVVSTLPSGLSRWLRMDLPSRVARMTRVPVTTVEAER